MTCYQRLPDNELTGYWCDNCGKLGGVELASEIPNGWIEVSLYMHACSDLRCQFAVHLKVFEDKDKNESRVHVSDRRGFGIF